MSAPATGAPGRPTLATVLRCALPAYTQSNRLPAHHWKVLRAIQACRTPELGGHLYQCPHCRAEHFVPHSCRNRHCPTCQGANSVDWLQKQAQALLPIPYFHLVFTLPHELNGQAEEKFILYRSADGGATWQWGGGTANAGGNHVLLSGISSFSRWTVSNKDTNPISGIGEATRGKTGLFSVFPNPAQVDQPLTLGLIEQGDYTLEVIDEQGRVVSQLPFSSSGPAGTSELQPGVSTPGAYYLLIRDGSALRRIYAAAPILIH